jgi:hypothetical protein
MGANSQSMHGFAYFRVFPSYDSSLWHERNFGAQSKLIAGKSCVWEEAPRIIYVRSGQNSSVRMSPINRV